MANTKPDASGWGQVNEKRLIDANAYAYPGDLINEPTIDAVEVVRCKDCKHHIRMICNHPYGLVHICEDGFCSYGERREDNGR